MHLCVFILPLVYQQHPCAPQERLMQYKSVQQAIVQGRVVLYSNPINGLSELAVVLGDAEEVGVAEVIHAGEKTSDLRGMHELAPVNFRAVSLIFICR